MKSWLVAVAGFKNSGKDTIGNALVSKFGFIKDSFANPVKDVLSVTFGWDRALLEGDTVESRVWREQVDEWWAAKLGIAEFSPRYALQHIGTDLFRDQFNDSIWIFSFEKRYIKNNTSFVITDCRFQNEIALIKRLGGVVFQVNRGPLPDWWDIAAEANKTSNLELCNYLENDLGIHSSEYSWIGTPSDYVIDNNGTKDDLLLKVEDIWKKHIAYIS